VIGHDWGAPVAWNAARLRPDRVRAVGGLSVAPSPPLPLPPTVLLRQIYGDTFYQLYFQEPGVAERELAEDVRGGLRRMLRGASGDAPAEQRWNPVLRGRFLDHLPDPGAAPAWFGEAQLDELTETFTRTGFRGGLNWYRNIDLNWELAGAFAGRVIEQPALFIIGDADPGYPASQRAIDALPQTLPGLRKSLILPGCGHWLGEERPDDVNAALLGFLADLG